MKKTIYKLLFVLPAFIVFSCVNEDEWNQFREGPTTDPLLQIEVIDTEGNPVSGASIDVFTNATDYANEANAVLTGLTTDASGIATIAPEDLGSERGVYFFSVSSGALRNWSSTVSTPYLYWTTGETKIPTTVAAVVPEFLAVLEVGEWLMTSYNYATGNVLPDYPACENDDTFLFRKDGLVFRLENADVCAEPSADQAPVSTPDDMVAWSGWSVSSDGTTITIRDLDPDYENGEVEATLTVSATEMTIDYGGPYVATMVPAN